jgi:diacylglycerol kinase (ATP)
VSDRRPLLLLANPASGGKPGAPALADAEPDALQPDALQAALEARGLDVTLHVIDEGDDLGAIATEAARSGRDLVAAGGDGTVAPVAAAACHSDVTLGILPLGSWNNIAHAWRIPERLDEALDAIGQGRSDAVDAALVWHAQDAEADNEAAPPDATRFFEAAGVGLDAAGFGAAELGERYGLWRAARSALRALRRRRSAMRLVVDGRRLRTVAPAVTVCNGPYMGMGFAIAPDADPSDGLLNVVVFAGMTRWEVLRHYLSVARRRPRPEPRTRHLLARSIAISGARRILPAHADGRSVGTTPIRVAVDPGALRVFR